MTRVRLDHRYKGHTMAQDSIASRVKRRQRAPQQPRDSVHAAMLVDDFQYRLKTICFPAEYQNDGQRPYPLQIIYDFAKHSGLDTDRVYYTTY